MQELENTIITPEYQAAKAQLKQHLQTLGCAVSGQKRENPAGERLTVISANGGEHTIHIRLLDLDKARSIKLPQSDFDYQLDAHVWWMRT